MAVPFLILVGRGIATAARAGARGASKGIQSVSRKSTQLFKGGKNGKKPNPKAKSAKDARKARNKRLKKWAKRLRKWFKRKAEEKLDNLSQVEQNQIEKEAKAKKIDTDSKEFEKGRFFYKRVDFSKNSTLDNILNDYNKRNQLRTFNITETQKRIDFILNHLYLQKIIRDKGMFIDNDNDNENDEDDGDIPQMEDNEEDSLWDTLLNFLNLLNFLGSLLDIVKSFVKDKVKKLKEKIKNLKNEAKKLKDKATKKIKNFLGFDDEEDSKKTKKNTQKTNNQKQPQKTQKENLKKQSLPKNTKDANFKSDNIPQSKNTGYPDLEKGLSDIKKMEEDHKKRIEIEDANHKKKIDNINKYIDALEVEYNDPKTGWWGRREIELKQGKAWLDKKALDAGYAAWKALDKLGELAKQAKAVATNVYNRFVEAWDTAKKTFKKIFRAAKGGGKVMASIAKKIPLIGTILSVIIGVFEIGNAKNAWEVRRAIGEMVGGSLGGIVGTAIGSFLPLIGNIIVGVLGALLGSAIGKELAKFFLEPLDFLPYDLYGQPLPAKMMGIREPYELAKKEDGVGSRDLDKMVAEAEKQGKYLDTTDADSSITSLAKQGAASALNKTGLGGEGTRYDLSQNQMLSSGMGFNGSGAIDVSELQGKFGNLSTDEKFREIAKLVGKYGTKNIRAKTGFDFYELVDTSMVDTTAAQGAKIVVTRHAVVKGNIIAKEGVGAGTGYFTHGTIELIDGKGRKLFQGIVTERPQEGLVSGKCLRVPPGVYNMTWGQGVKHPDRPVLWNDSVKMDRAIMIHMGNTLNWSHGCLVISKGNTFSPGHVGETGTTADAAATAIELIAKVKKLLGLTLQKQARGNLPIKTYIFNKFVNDGTAGAGAAGSEKYPSPQTITNQKTIVKQNVVIVDKNKKSA